MHKRNSFTDFVDVARWLVAQGYAAKDRVAAMGGSAGGLLMGAVANIAPTDYRAIVAQVPFVDVVTTMLDTSVPLTTNEFDETGTGTRPLVFRIDREAGHGGKSGRFMRLHEKAEQIAFVLREVGAAR